MGEVTGIAWTDHTFNPWMGCTKVSPACDHCYAETLSKRTGKADWGDDAPRVVTSDGYWRNPLKWNAAAAGGALGVRGAIGRHLVFCASLADVFEARADVVQPRRRLFDLIAETPALDWQLLTKRPENVLALVPPAWHHDGFPANVWIGTTVEDQQRADERIPELLEIPAAVRFLSMEPLLGFVDLETWLMPDAGGCNCGVGPGGYHGLHEPRCGVNPSAIDWVIVGGESGPGHRHLDVEHAQAIRHQCAAVAVPFFFKQIGGQYPTSGGDRLDGEVIKQFPTAVPA